MDSKSRRSFFRHDDSGCWRIRGVCRSDLRLNPVARQGDTDREPVSLVEHAGQALARAVDLLSYPNA